MNDFVVLVGSMITIYLKQTVQLTPPFFDKFPAPLLHSFLQLLQNLKSSSIIFYFHHFCNIHNLFYYLFNSTKTSSTSNKTPAPRSISAKPPNVSHRFRSGNTKTPFPISVKYPRYFRLISKIPN